jgi:hypothetical protein
MFERMTNHLNETTRHGLTFILGRLPKLNYYNPSLPQIIAELFSQSLNQMALRRMTEKDSDHLALFVNLASASRNIIPATVSICNDVS